MVTIADVLNDKNMISEKQDFEEHEGGGVYMTARGKRIFIKEFEKKLSQIICYNNVKKSYSELIHMEVNKVQQYFQSNIDYKPYKYVN